MGGLIYQLVHQIDNNIVLSLKVSSHQLQAESKSEAYSLKLAAFYMKEQVMLTTVEHY